MKYKNGKDIKNYDVIRWNCYDSDDNITWVMTGIYKAKGVVYLGGGVDFGTAIGSIVPCDEVLADSENNDEGERGIDKVGVVSGLVRHIKKFNQITQNHKD